MVAAETHLNSLLTIIAEEVRNILSADRCSVFLVDPFGPASRQLVLERFRLANAAKRVVLCFLDKPENAEGFFSIELNPTRRGLPER